MKSKKKKPRGAEERVKKMLQGFKTQIFKDKKKEANRRATRKYDWRMDEDF